MNSQPRPHTKVDLLKAQTNVTSRPTQVAPGEPLQRSGFADRELSLERATIKSSKKRHRTPDPTASKEIQSVEAYETSAVQDFVLRMGSPWDWYREVLQLDRNGPVTVAERKAPQSGLVAIRVFPSTAAEKALERHQRIKHDNIIPVLDAFTTDTSLYIILEHSPISLEQIVQGAMYPTEWQLAAILKQVLCALVYLEREKFEHGSLNCSNILLSTQGSVKIANQQCCETVDGTDEPRDVRALGLITMELMQKYTKDDGAIGVDNLRRWPSDCDAVAFLSETTSAASAHELQNHALLRRRTRKEDLLGLIFSAEVSAPRDYSCHA